MDEKRHLDGRANVYTFSHVRHVSHILSRWLTIWTRRARPADTIVLFCGYKTISARPDVQLRCRLRRARQAIALYAIHRLPIASLLECQLSLLNIPYLLRLLRLRTTD